MISSEPRGKLWPLELFEPAKRAEPGTARDGHGPHFAVQSLDLLSLTSPRVGQASEDLGSLSGAVLHDLRMERHHTPDATLWVNCKARALVHWTLQRAVCPPSFSMASSLGMVFSWKVIHSSQLWVASICLAISATFHRITGCWIRVLPKVFRLPANFSDSSRQTRANRVLMAQKAKRSWLKFCIMYLQRFWRKGQRQAKVAATRRELWKDHSMPKRCTSRVARQGRTKDRGSKSGCRTGFLCFIHGHAASILRFPFCEPAISTATPRQRPKIL